MANGTVAEQIPDAPPLQNPTGSPTPFGAGIPAAPESIPDAPPLGKSDKVAAAKGPLARGLAGAGHYAISTGEAMGAPPEVSDFATGPIYTARHPWEATKLFFSNLTSAQKNQWRRSANDARQGWINRNPDQLVAGIGEGVNAAIPLVGLGLQGISDAAASGDWTGAAGKMTGMILNIFGPHAAEAVASKISGPASAAKAAETIPAANRMQSAAGISNEEVANVAQANKVTLTGPGQRTLRAMGEKAVTGGAREVERFNTANTKALIDWGNGIRDGFDPKTGASDMSAGRAIRDSVSDMKDADITGANKAYTDVKIGGQPISKVIDHGDLSPVRHAIDVEQNETLASGMTKERYHSPDVQTAVDDIKGELKRVEGLIDLSTGKPAVDPATGKPVVSWDDMRALRTYFMRKGHTYDGTVPKEARTVYQQAAGATDGSMSDAASQHGTYVEQQWRDANKKWTEIQENYNGKKSPLRRVLETHELSPDKALGEFTDPAAGELIQLAKDKGLDMGPVKARVFDNIRAKNFGTDKAGRIGGYSDSYLQSLYTPEEMRQIHIHGEVARQLGYDVNPSGTAKAAAAFGQIMGAIGLIGGAFTGSTGNVVGGVAQAVAGIAAPEIAARAGTSTSLTNWARTTPAPRTTPFAPTKMAVGGGAQASANLKADQIRKQKEQQ